MFIESCTTHQIISIILQCPQLKVAILPATGLLSFKTFDNIEDFDLNKVFTF
jgi:hypothetical protein